MTLKATFSLDSLVQFIVEHATNDYLVSPEESRRNLEQNIVGIYNLEISHSVDATLGSLNVGSAGCGLRLTTDGYILTAYHVVEEAYKTLQGAVDGPDFVLIQDPKKNKYFLDPSFTAIYPEYDLALVKVYDPQVGEPIRFNLNYEGLGFLQKISALALDHKSQEVTSEEGVVYGLLKDYPTSNSDGTAVREIIELFLTSVPIRSGNSGGIFITEDGSLAGTICSRTSLLKEGNSQNVDAGCGVDICYAIDLIGQTYTSLFGKRSA